MTWPTTVTTTYTGNASASIANARSEIYDTTVAVNDIIGSRGSASGIASLDASTKIPTEQLPTTYSTTSLDLTLAPATERVSINNIVNLEPRTVTQLNAIVTPVTGDVAYCSNGSAGAACLAVYNGSAWKVVSLGSTISSS